MKNFLIGSVRTLLLAVALAVTPISLDTTGRFSAQYAHAVEVDLQFLKGTQFADSAGAPLGSGTINIYDSGTTSLRTTYSDKDGSVASTLNGSNQIVLDSAGRLSESVYIPTGAWKFVLKDSAGATIVTEDSIEGALDTSAFTVTSAKPEMPVLSKTADYTVTTSDLGKCINANPTGGSFTITMVSASSAGDSKTLCVRHVGTANRVTVAGVSSQTINSKATHVLVNQHQTIWLVSDGANWHVVSQATPVGSQVITVTDRLTAPPASPTAGNCYIVNGTPTGTWASYAQHDVVCATGTGSWSKYTPTDGWVGYVTDETLLVQYRTSAWVDLSAVTSPSSSTIRMLVARHQAETGTNGGTATATGWTKRSLTVTDQNTITTANGAGCDASISSSVITLCSGKYLVFFNQQFGTSASAGTRLQNTTTSSVALNGSGHNATTVHLNAFGSGLVSITTASTNTLELQYYVSATTSTADLGSPFAGGGITGRAETYAIISIIDLASLQGPQGSQGAQGATGYTGHQYTYSNSTTLADPGAGILRLSSTTLSAVTSLAIDATSAASGNPTVTTDIKSWEGSRLQIRKVGAEQNFVILDINSVTDNSGWLQLNASSVISSSGSFTDADSLSVTVQPRGTSGQTGSSLPPLDYSFITATSGDPGSGNALFNNATWASVTQVNISETDRLGVDVSGVIGSFDDSGAAANRGTFYAYVTANPITRAVFTVTGAVTDFGAYSAFAVSPISTNGTLTATTNISVLFVPTGATGAAGAISGSTGGTDNAILRADGAGGSTIQNSTVTISDTGAATGFTEITASSNINTTAGKVKENSVNISPIGKQTIYIPAGAMLARTTNGCAAAAISEAITNRVVIKTMDCDASTQEHFQFQFVAPKSFNLSTVTWKAHWTHQVTTTNFGVVWGLQCQGLGDSDAIDNAFGTAITAADTGGTTDDLYITPESSALTVANVAARDLVLCQGFRAAADGSDTLAIDARLVGMELIYTTSASNDD